MKRLFIVVAVLLSIVVGLPFATGLAQEVNPVDGMSPLELVADGFVGLENAEWMPDQITLLFSDGREGKLYQLGPSSEVTVAATGTGHGGLALTPDGFPLVATGPRIVRLRTRTAPFDATGEVVADAGAAGRPVFFNDLAVRHDGRIYATSLSGNAPTWVATIAPDRRIEVVWDEQPGEPGGPNGIALSPDQSVLYVSFIRSGHVLAFQLGDDGLPVSAATFAAGLRGPDGMCVDQAGNVFVSTNTPGLHVFSPEGEPLGVIRVPEPRGERTPNWNLVTNCAFGGPDGMTLYITAQQALYRATVPIPGAGLNGR